NFPRRIEKPIGTWIALYAPLVIALVQPVRYAVGRVYAPLTASAGAAQSAVLVAVTVGYTLAGLLLLFAHYHRLTDATERRRVKILGVGALGLAPGLFVGPFYLMRAQYNYSQSIFASGRTALGTLSLLLFPTAFACAILRHRLLDVSVMIRQG